MIDDEDTLSPFDEYAVQIPGRLLTVEILTILLMRELPRHRREAIFAEADAALTSCEAGVHARNTAQTDDYALKMFAVARDNLDHIAAKAMEAG